MPCTLVLLRLPPKKHYNWPANRAYMEQPPPPFSSPTWLKSLPVKVWRPIKLCSSTMPSGPPASQEHTTPFCKEKSTVYQFLIGRDCKASAFLRKAPALQALPLKN